MTSTGAAIGLGLAALVLSGTIAMELAGLDAGPARAPGLRSPAARVASRDPMPSPQQIDRKLDAILGRPIFSPDRRPIDRAQGVPGLSRLTGIIVAGSRRIAIFAPPGDGHSIVAEAGAHIDAFLIVSISDTGVTVSGPDGTRVVTPVFGPPPQRPLKPLAPLRPKPLAPPKA
jgi:hypothetical protein